MRSSMLLFVIAACAPSPPTVPILSDLGRHHVAISTRDTLAQAYFDQGMRLVYAFNHAEAIRSFREAGRIDGDCAICAWGEALAHGPNINLPMDSANGAQALAAIAEAEGLASKASPREQDLIRALSVRYGPDPAAQASRDSAYARSMESLLDRYADDAEIATLYAEAVMNLSPWNYWNPDGTPRPGMDRAIMELERVMAGNPEHPGACHYYIHAVEAVHPARAVPCAERLARTMPGAGHLVHMPAHIYVRVGRYADAVEANLHAAHADSVYLGIDRAPGFYDVGYVPHNHHFLAFAATLAGTPEPAIRAARAAAALTGPEGAKLALETEFVLPAPHLVLAAFELWDSVLTEPMPPAGLDVATGLALYARGTALAAKARGKEAEIALDTVRTLAARAPEGTRRQLLGVAEHALAGEIARRERRWRDAERELRTAAAIEDSLPYMEPPYWFSPVRHTLGAVLLEAGRAAPAETVYRQALERFPDNGWAMTGLRRSLTAQGRHREARDISGRPDVSFKP